MASLYNDADFIAKTKNAAQLCLSHGAVDLSAYLDYTAVRRWFRHVNAPAVAVDYDLLEQAAHNVEEYRESDGCMVWEINMDKYADEYLRLIKEKADA